MPLASLGCKKAKQSLTKSSVCSDAKEWPYVCVFHMFHASPLFRYTLYGQHVRPIVIKWRRIDATKNALNADVTVDGVVPPLMEAARALWRFTNGPDHAEWVRIIASRTVGLELCRFQFLKNSYFDSFHQWHEFTPAVCCGVWHMSSLGVAVAAI